MEEHEAAAAERQRRLAKARAESERLAGEAAAREQRAEELRSRLEALGVQKHELVVQLKQVRTLKLDAPLAYLEPRAGGAAEPGPEDDRRR